MFDRDLPYSVASYRLTDVQPLIEALRRPLVDLPTNGITPEEPLLDQYDPISVHILAHCGDQLAGGVRVYERSNGPYRHDELTHWDQLADDVGLGPDELLAKAAMISRLFVTPGHRGRRTGLAPVAVSLIEAAGRVAAERRCSVVVVAIASANERAAQMFMGLGYEAYGPNTILHGLEYRNLFLSLGT